MIIGTAGHIDHGKTALVKALTGVDADRLKEEKARGITIDLGFAYLPLGGDRSVGFVDVPGHERFVGTMLAGASGIDFAMLVVAADDGIMPQTREHLAILDLLGIERGVVVLSKVDLVGADRRTQVTADLGAAIRASGLRDAAILPVSTLTGEGVADLRAAIAAAELAMPPGRTGGRFRLAVDRCFTIVGAGTVVTGTIVSGQVCVGDRVLVSPSGIAARVRSVHAQGRPVERGRCGLRYALNLAGEAVAKHAIKRGDVVLDPALHAPTDRIDAVLRLLPSEAKPLRDGTLARFHQASAETGVRIVPLGDPVGPGATARVQLVLDRPVAAAVGDRFVLRDASAQRTIGGGRLLDLRPPARKRRTAERHRQLDALSQADPATALAGLLEVPPFVVDLEAFGRDRALAKAEVTALREGVVAIEADGLLLALSPSRRDRIVEELEAQLAGFHQDHADEQGLGREDLRRRTDPRLPAAAFAAVLEAQARAGTLVLAGAFVRLPGHTARLNPPDEDLWGRLKPLIAGEARFRPPRVRDLARLTGAGEADVRRTLRVCARLGRVDQIAHDHFFARATTAEMVELALATSLAAPEGWFTAAAFRDCMDNGRKVAIQILDFFDQRGITMRRGDLRRINPHRQDLYRAEGPVTQTGRESSLVGRPDFKSGWGSETVPGGFDSRSLPPPPRS